MKLLLSSIAQSLKDNLIHGLISKGVEVYIDDNPESGLQKMRSKQIYFCMIDDDFKEPDYYSFFSYIKSKDADYPYRLILFTKSTDKDFVSRYINLGLVSVVSKKLELPDLIKTIISILDKHAKEGDSRKIIHIKPPQEDKIAIALPIGEGAQQKQVKGTVIDLSPQGCAFEFDIPSESYHFSEGQQLETVDLFIHKRVLFNSCKIVKIKSPLCVVVWEKPKDSFMKGVCHYLYEKFSNSQPLEE